MYCTCSSILFVSVGPSLGYLEPHFQKPLAKSFARSRGMSAHGELAVAADEGSKARPNFFGLFCLVI